MVTGNKQSICKNLTALHDRQNELSPNIIPYFIKPEVTELMG